MTELLTPVPVTPALPIPAPAPGRRPARVARPNRAIRSVHLVGICGSGMKALAELASDLGWQVTGSDLLPSTPALAWMAARGLRVHQGHRQEFLPGHVDALVYSPAVEPDNPERLAAAALGIPQFSYSGMLGLLMRERIGVCVAGTHGKSTTSAMTATILEHAGLAPSAVVGAELCGRGASGWGGTGKLFVVESCEYRHSFLDLSPKYACILSVEPDHFDCFADFDENKVAFASFAGNVHDGGLLLVNGDSPAALEAAAWTTARVETFSQRPGGDWWGTDSRQTAFGTRFRIFHRGAFFTEVLLAVPGEHNVSNALAASALSHAAGAQPADIREGLAEFQGIRRRFERVGSYRGVTIVDDYAHHPTAVRTTLATARQQFGRRRVWCAFQPHQVSRVRALIDEFAVSFGDADQVLVAPVFAAREAGTGGAAAMSELLAERIAAAGTNARFVPSLDQITATLDDEARPGDVLITMGAGDIDRVHHELTGRLRRDHAAG
ncbi:MAG TPA: UDP-N-acetylmuramate--L-alanine ligase [Planctomycetaceae bacterium]|nr:UDP-N-acetylmuramate--L-alanine ligase [Planctomycetaceae bacterium]